MTPDAPLTPHPIYVCPTCRASLAALPQALSCGACGRSYPFEDGIADFVEGRYYDRFEPGQELSLPAAAGLRNEAVGVRQRIENYYLPRIEDARRRSGKRSADWRVFDCGCGNGLSVDLLNEAGLAAWGNDSSALRKWQWRERSRRDRLFVADAGALPVPDGFFDVVLACGVLEHVGVVESRIEGYGVRPLGSRDDDRRAFLAELLRVTASGGTIWLDFPNGAFPIDFWHGETPGAARVHGPREGFLPTAGEVRGYLGALPTSTTVRFHGPDRRLQMRQVRRHWYGKLLHLPARLFLKAIDLAPLRSLVESRLNPYLVVEIEKQRLAIRR